MRTQAASCCCFPPPGCFVLPLALLLVLLARPASPQQQNANSAAPADPYGSILQSSGASRRSKGGGRSEGKPRRRSKAAPQQGRATLSAPPVPDMTIQHMLAMRRSLATVAAAQHAGLFDMARGSPFTADRVASKLSITPRAAEAMVAVLASLGLAAVQDDGAFVLSEEAQAYLVSDSPFFHRSLLDQEDLPRFQQTRTALTSDETDVVTPFAVNLEKMAPQQIEGFVEQMHTFTLPAASAVGELPAFGAIERLLDVGGGSGSLSIGVATHNPGVAVTLLDLAPVCKIAKNHIAEYGLSASVQTLTGSMFDTLPSGFDGMLFGNVFHDWSWETCRDLARRAFESLTPGGTIFLHEMLLWPQKDGPLTVAAFSVDMLVHELGKQFTQAELEGLLQSAGFVNIQTVPTFGHYSMVMGEKPVT